MLLELKRYSHLASAIKKTKDILIMSDVVNIVHTDGLVIQGHRLVWYRSNVSGLNHWPLGDVYEILDKLFSNWF